ncbi:hypothetical protein BXZ70DRAFT_1006613 [Cristinia sonorae]|uniref:Uncharacterized protein n=1 Tax=Cristinia sonorae TaxID=1940300 RepID=A0A8K0URZ4_9AGAR|nr:hypothetical protein BXZ70DRAFT_1006613 [Cristinia sonorae]
MDKLPPVAYATLVVVVCVGKLVHGVEQNFTIDDQIGDIRTGRKVNYLGVWSSGNVCPMCVGKTPDPAQAHSGSWHYSDALAAQTPNSGFTFNFTGTAVYIYAILQNSSPTYLDITLDGGSPVAFSPPSELVHDPPMTFYYGFPVFSSAGIINGDHTVTVELRQNLGIIGTGTMLLFDYIVYTMDISDLGSPATTPLPTSIAPSQTSSFTGSAQFRSDIPSLRSEASPQSNAPRSSTSPATLLGSSAGDTQIGSVTRTQSSTPLQALNPAVSTTQPNNQHIHPAVIGGAIAVPAIVVLLSLLAWYLYRRRSRKLQDAYTKKDQPPFELDAHDNGATVARQLPASESDASHPEAEEGLERPLSDAKIDEERTPGRLYADSDVLSTNEPPTPAEQNVGYRMYTGPTLLTSSDDETAAVRAELALRHDRRVQMMWLEMGDLGDQDEEQLPPYSPPRSDRVPSPVA